jgi:hypothetical protein
MAPSRNKVELLISVIVVLFFVWILWEARNWPAQSKLFPWSLGLSSLVLALIQVTIAVRAAFKELATDAETGAEDGRASADRSFSVSEAAAARWRALILCGWVVGFFLGICLLGFKVGALCLTFLFLRFTANENWTISAAMAVGSYLFFWLVFDVALGVPLDNGLIGDYFGWS